MAVTLSRVLADGGEQKQKLTTKVHCVLCMMCAIHSPSFFNVSINVWSTTPYQAIVGDLTN